MHNFTLHTPTKVLFGKGQVARLREQIPSNARILITYGGGSVVRSGLLAQIRHELAGMTLFEFGGIEPNPAYETLMGAVELARAERVDFLLAVGGGSVLDGTKFIAAAAHYDLAKEPWHILETVGGEVASLVGVLEPGQAKGIASGEPTEEGIEAAQLRSGMDAGAD